MIASKANFSTTLALIFILILGASVAYAQSDTSTLRHTTTALNKWTAANPAEKVYLHLDKINYEPYDTIWYKAYTVTGVHHGLSAISGVLYVELTNRDSVITRQIVPLTSGVAWGDIPLPVFIKGGDYHIRAYTNWMRNAGPEYFYNQQIHIGDGAVHATAKTVINTNPDVQFFPEGGYMVNGLRTKIAVKALNSSGFGQDIKGTIEDNDGDVIVDFATQHLGMGQFALTPQSGKTYKAKVVSGETMFTVDLPKAKEQGFTLGINNNNPDSLFLRVAVNEATFGEKQHAAFYLLGQSNGKIYYTAISTLEDRSFSAAIDKKRFPTGIVQFTLFSASGEPLNERSAFIENSDTLQLNINSAVKSYAPSQSTKMAVEVKNNAGQRVTGTFSVAVIKENSATDNDSVRSDILSNLLLTAELKETVENPGYYFTNTNKQTRQDLDALMLTQDYQQLEWKEVLNDKTVQPAYLPENSLELKGSIKSYSGKPVPNAKITLMAAHDNFLADTTTDVNGNFTFTDVDLPDSSKILLSAKSKNNGRDVNITVQPTNYPPIAKQKTTALNTPLAISAVSLPDSTKAHAPKTIDLRNRQLLKEVTIKSHRIPVREKPDLSASDNLNGPGAADQVIMDSELKGCVNLSDCLIGIINGVQIINGIPHNLRKFDVHGPPVMTLVIDGAISNGTKLDDLNPNSIHSIEVLKSDSYLGIYGGRVGGGALVITTKRAGDKSYFNTEPLPGTLKYTFNGFYKAHEFYSPQYNIPGSADSNADLRTTIYWNPNIITDKEGKATIEYFNADTKGTYRVIIEGIDGDGNLGRVVYRYKVEKKDDN